MLGLARPAIPLDLRWVDPKVARKGKKTTQRDTPRSWPIDPDQVTDIKEFQTLLYNRVTKAPTRVHHMSGIRMLLSMFHLDGYTLLEFMERLLDDQLMSQVLNLNILAADLPWTVKMLTSLGKACAYLGSRASLSGKAFLGVKLAALQSEFIKPRLKLCSQAKNEQLAARDEEEDEWIQDMASADTLKLAVIEMIKDLATCAYALGGVPPRGKSCA